MWKNNLENVSWKEMFLGAILRMNVSEYNAFVCFTNHLNVKHFVSQTEERFHFSFVHKTSMRSDTQSQSRLKAQSHQFQQCNVENSTLIKLQHQCVEPKFTTNLKHEKKWQWKGKMRWKHLACKIAC